MICKIWVYSVGHFENNVGTFYDCDKQKKIAAESIPTFCGN